MDRSDASAGRSTTIPKTMSLLFRKTSLSYVNLLYLVERFVLLLEQNICRDFGKYMRGQSGRCNRSLPLAAYVECVVLTVGQRGMPSNHSGYCLQQFAATQAIQQR